jgi:uncharacterized Zn finger protein
MNRARPYLWCGTCSQARRHEWLNRDEHGKQQMKCTECGSIRSLEAQRRKSR